jgi:dTDP-4-dehydrorhamnose reductase
LDPKTILVTGADGQLGRALRELAPGFHWYTFIFTTKEQLPITDPTAIAQFFSAHKVDCCINCAAYTAVDKAETETEMAFQVNADAVGNLAATCKLHEALFIHISTDYVFDGTATLPYKEDHPVSPVNLYGASKLKGEELAKTNNEAALIIRTSWVYAPVGNNFVNTMLRLMKERDNIKVVSDQRGCPTYAPDLAAAILQVVTKLDCSPGTLLARKLPSNIFHYSNSGVITWYEFALAIKEISGSKCVVDPIPTSAYPTPAKRPAYSVMDTTKIQQVFGISIPSWKESLQKCMAVIARQHSGN